jgi:tRNA (guanine10-N2)-dimethyltransferase
MQLAILGRQPKLGMAELESLLGADAVQPAGHMAALITSDVDPGRLGGVIRLAKLLHEIPSTNWNQIAAYLTNNLPKHLEYLPEGKLKLGISLFGVAINSKQLFATELELKKACRATGRSVRIIPNTAPELNSAQVIHNQLIGGLGMELLLLKNDGKTLLAQTTWVQDVDSYAARDFGRPKRDAFVGMLPPKLAQTMLNLAQVHAGQRVLDPFCGTGVVLQEAALIKAIPYGTDLSEKMVDYSRANLSWLNGQYKDLPTPVIELGDATNYQWQPPLDTIVCETYLGQPLSGLPKPEKLAEIIRDCNTIISKFFKNLHSQVAPGTKMCVAVPAWRVGQTFRHLELLDHLEDLGYNRVRFQHAEFKDLIYHREDQIVARQLLVLIVK